MKLDIEIAKTLSNKIYSGLQTSTSNYHIHILLMVMWVEFSKILKNFKHGQIKNSLHLEVYSSRHRDIVYILGTHGRWCLVGYEHGG